MNVNQDVTISFPDIMEFEELRREIMDVLYHDVDLDIVTKYPNLEKLYHVIKNT